MTYCYIDAAGYEVCDNDDWDSWERWLVLGLVVGIAVLFIVGFLLFSCITARRRKNAGMQPYRGTAWTLGVTPPGHNPPTYTKDVELGPQAPPAYNAAANDGNDDAWRDVRPGQENVSSPVYPPPAQQPLPRGEHEPTQ